MYIISSYRAKRSVTCFAFIRIVVSVTHNINSSSCDAQSKPTVLWCKEWVCRRAAMPLAQGHLCPVIPLWKPILTAPCSRKAKRTHARMCNDVHQARLFVPSNTGTFLWYFNQTAHALIIQLHFHTYMCAYINYFERVKQECLINLCLAFILILFFNIQIN